MGSIARVEFQSSELDSRSVIVEAVRAISGLSAELDRTRAERDRLRALVGSQGKATISEAA